MVHSACCWCLFSSYRTSGKVIWYSSKIFCRFLDRGGVIEAEVIGSRYNLGQGKGLEVPIDYKFIANSMKSIRYLSTARKALTNLRPDTADTIMIETFH